MRHHLGYGQSLKVSGLRRWGLLVAYRDITARYAHVSHKALLGAANQITKALLNNEEKSTNVFHL